MLAYYNTTPYPCQPLFQKKINYFNLSPCNLSFSLVFACFRHSNALENSFFDVDNPPLKSEYKKSPEQDSFLSFGWFV